MSYDEYIELAEYIEKKEKENVKNTFVAASYNAYQVGNFLGTSKARSFGKYLDTIGLKYGESEKLTKEESELIKKKSMAVVEKISKMKRVKKGKIR